MILVTGANGFVGNAIMRTCKNVVGSPSLRTASADDIKRIIEKNNIDAIVHTAAISDVGVCEANPEASYVANVQLPVLLAQASRGMKLICFSSDQVYTGTEEFGPYTEDMAKPDNTYARHKLEMEQRVLDLAPDAVMLRAEWMYDYHSPKSNYFINMLQARGSVCGSSRQFRGVTYVKEVAENMERVMNLPGGVYNFGSETSKSVYAITKEFLSFLGRDIPVEDMAPGHNLWMNCDKAKKYGVMFSSVEDGLRKCAEDYNLLK